MKILKKFMVCFAVIISLSFVFTACGKKNDGENNGNQGGGDTPAPVETFTTVDLSLDELEVLISSLTCKMEGTFKATINTTYANGTTDVATEYAVFSEDDFNASIEISNDSGTGYKAYKNGNYIYYDDGIQKLYNLISEPIKTNEAGYKTGDAYGYIYSVLTPAVSSDFNIYDGSLFKNIKEAYGFIDISSGEGEGSEIEDGGILEDPNAALLERFTIKRTYGTIHSNIEIEYRVNEDNYTIYTLKFESGEVIGLDIKIKNENLEREISFEESNNQLVLPEFDEFLPEVKDENVDDSTVIA